MPSKRVYLGGWKEADVSRGYTVLTPNENAARTLEVTPLSLEALAQQVLGEERIAHPVSVQRLLSEAVEEVLESAAILLALGSPGSTKSSAVISAASAITT